MERTSLSTADIIPMEEYAKDRKERRTAMSATKRDRRISCGPDATFYFESYETMWHQVHEMLFIEKGGEAQIADELSAYNPLIPKGKELVATLMFEIDDEVRRQSFLAGLGGVEETITFEFEDEQVLGVPEEDVDRTTADGKASSVQFIHFPFTDAQIAKFKKPDQRVLLGIGHPKYGHITVISEVAREALTKDFL
ncbi:DUF3501 family protein [Rhodospirillales bacterium]|jgi:hypothetical protein|nr:DUF3501 family protein [Rhodospirillales bacterium]